MSDIDVSTLGRELASNLKDILGISSFSGDGEDREEWRRKYWNDPVSWARDHIKWPVDSKGKSRFLTDYQQDTANRLVSNKRALMIGPRGNGKSALVSIFTLFFICTRDDFVDWKVLITAGGFRQVEKFTFPEIHKWARLLRWDRLGRKAWSTRDELMRLSLRGHTGEATGAACSDPNLIEGGHASQVLVILDEAKSVPEGVWDSIEGMLVSSGIDDREAFVLATSIPGAPSGRFYQIASQQKGFEEWSPGIRHIQPQEAIAAGRMTEKWAMNRARQWGINSALFKNHVLGEFADAAADGVIPSHWIEDAQARSPSEASGPEDGSKVKSLGVDPASGGCNESVLAVRKGWAITELQCFQSNDTMEIVRRVVALHQRHQFDWIQIDAVGVGAGPFDRLRELNLPVRPFNGGSSAPGSDSSGEIEFLNARAWSWWFVRELFHPYGSAKISIPNDPILLSQLAVATYRRTQHGKLQIEGKEEIERRLRKLNPDTTVSTSPDRADAVVLAFADPGSDFENAYSILLGSQAPPETSQFRNNQQLVAHQVAFEAERKRVAEERESKARPKQQQLNDLMLRGAKHNSLDPWWK